MTWLIWYDVIILSMYLPHHVCMTRGLRGPELESHPEVGHADDEEGHGVLQHGKDDAVDLVEGHHDLVIRLLVLLDAAPPHAAERF